MSEDFIDETFADLEFYPGSKRRRRTFVETKTATVENDGWDAHPLIKRLPNGKEVEMFTAGALAAALGRPLVTLRVWERRGYIPSAPYRLRGASKEFAGRRLYTRALIDRTVEMFAERGLLGATRINWSQHRDLTIQLFESWKSIHKSENA